MKKLKYEINYSAFMIILAAIILILDVIVVPLLSFLSNFKRSK